jgi:hypothetical protein
VNGLNDTASNATTQLIENLLPLTQYSFRVQSWLNGTGNNVTNIANTTTLGGDRLTIEDAEDILTDPGVNLDVFDWDFKRSDPDDTTAILLVNYPSTFNATCTFDNKFSRTSSTLSNLATQPIGDGRVYANFTFLNIQNEIVTITCVDENTNSTGRYLMTQNDFPILDQIDLFRDGTFGTMGQFGIFDFTTLAIIILSMIGFNRVHPGVGAIFNFIIISVAASFGIIETWSAVMGGIVTVVLLLALLVHHRNDVVN